MSKREGFLSYAVAELLLDPLVGVRVLVRVADVVGVHLVVRQHDLRAQALGL